MLNSRTILHSTKWTKYSIYNYSFCFIPSLVLDRVLWGYLFLEVQVSTFCPKHSGFSIDSLAGMIQQTISTQKDSLNKKSFFDIQWDIVGHDMMGRASGHPHLDLPPKLTRTGWSQACGGDEEVFRRIVDGKSWQGWKQFFQQLMIQIRHLFGCNPTSNKIKTNLKTVYPTSMLPFEFVSWIFQQSQQIWRTAQQCIGEAFQIFFHFTGLQGLHVERIAHISQFRYEIEKC